MSTVSKYIPLLWILLLTLAIVALKNEGASHPTAVLKWIQDKRLASKQSAGIKHLNMLMPAADANKKLIRMNNSEIEFSLPEDFIAYFEHMAAVMPQNAPGRTVLGFCYYKQGHYERAYEQFSISCSLDPSSFWACQNLAMMHLQLNEFKSAEKLFSLVLSQDPHQAVEGMRSSKVYRDILSSDPSYNPVLSLQLGYAHAAEVLSLLQSNPSKTIDRNDIQIKIF